MKIYSVFLFFLICFQHISHSQCDEYYINELIGGNEGNCKYNSGAKLSFCPNSNTISIDAENGRQTFKIIKTDFPDKSSFGTQLFTLAQRGGQVGMAKLIMKDKTFGMQINGCGGSRTYSISLTKEGYSEWLSEKPKRDEEKRKAEEKIQEEEIRNQRIKTLMEKHHIDEYQKIDTAKVNDLINDDSEFFVELLKFYEGDSLVVYFDKHGDFEESNSNFYRMLPGYCSNLDARLKNYTGELSSTDFKEMQEINSLRSLRCRRTGYFAKNWMENYFHRLFKSEILGRDTIIDNVTIPLKSKLVITFSSKKVSKTEYIGAPSKFNGKDLFYLDQKCDGYSGYYTDKNTGKLKNVSKKENQNIDYILKKALIVKGIYINERYANDILIDKKNAGQWKEIYKYKKVKLK